ncbi:MAG: hypothetical protein Q9211_002429 [Gyalolechia sp. 1 TL-2023]
MRDTENEQHSTHPAEVEKTGREDLERLEETTTTASTHPAPVKIPKSRRRGLLGRFTLVAEIEDPQDYARSTKWYITFVVALAAMAAPMGSAIILRAGTIADIWHVKERGNAMSIFYIGPLCGPLLAPIVGGALAQRWGWRSTQWFIALYGCVILLFLVFALPETLKVSKPMPDTTDIEEAVPNEEVLARVNSRHRLQEATMKWTRMLKRWFVDPLKIILYLRFPAVSITVYYASITFGVLYMLNISLEDTFSKPPYSFSTVKVGLVYIPNSLGYLLASLFGGRWTDRIMEREAKRAGRRDGKGRLIYRPEERMRENAWIAAFLYPAALIWYGWTAEKGVHWVVPLIANFWFGVGSMLVFAMATTMLTEFMPKKASSGVAVNNLVRNIFSCVGAVTAQPLISAIGNGWLFTGLGVIAMASSVVIWAMRKYGPRWRKVMDKELN